MNKSDDTNSHFGKVVIIKTALGIYQFKVDLYESGTIDSAGKGQVEGDKIMTCTSDWVKKSSKKGEDFAESPTLDDLKDSVVDDFALAPGKQKLIRTFNRNFQAQSGLSCSD